MYEGLRLTELHEEWAWSCEAARRWAGLDEGEAHAQQRDRFDAEIRARVAAQEIGRYEACCPLCHRTLFITDDLLEATRERIYLCSSDGTCAGAVSFGRPQLKDFGAGLLSGIPDAERVYPAKRRGIPSPLKIRNMAGEMVPVSELEAFFREWTHHAQHAVPVEGCHLCRGTIRFSLPAHLEKQ